MKIAVLSGKGGAGKTFISVNLAAMCPHSVYIDCDVEEPNGRLFFKPSDLKEENVYTVVPEFNESLCNGCRACVDFCRFNAIVYLKNKPMVFNDVCHACGGCSLVCPTKAISEVNRKVGIIEYGKSKDVTVVTGVLNLGEASAVPVIKSALEYGCNQGDTVFIDCPPGSSCSVVESITDADYCVITVEATAFGFHDFKMVYELTKLLGKKIGVVINKAENDYQPLLHFCEQQDIPVLLRIPFNKDIASTISLGEIASLNYESYADMFRALLDRIRSECK